MVSPFVQQFDFGVPSVAPLANGLQGLGRQSLETKRQNRLSDLASAALTDQDSLVRLMALDPEVGQKIADIVNNNDEEAAARAQERMEQVTREVTAIKSVTDPDKRQRLIAKFAAEAKARGESTDDYVALSNMSHEDQDLDLIIDLAKTDAGLKVLSGVAGTAEERSFNSLIENFSDEDKEKARLIKAGLLPKATALGDRGERLEDLLIAERIKREASVGEFGDIREQDIATAGDLEASKVAGGGEAKAVLARKEGAEKRINSYDNSKFKSDAGLKVAEEAQALVSNMTAGAIGNLLDAVPGTDAFALAQKIDTLLANLSFKELAEMRAASPTGGALGSIAVRELELLGKTLASLAQGNKPAELKKNIGVVKDSLVRFNRALDEQRALDVKTLGRDPFALDQMTDEELEALANGQ